MFKKAIRSVLVSPASHFLPAAPAASGSSQNSVQPAVSQLQDVISSRRASAGSMQGLRTATWTPASSVSLSVIENAVFMGIGGYFCFGLGSVLGLY